MTKVSIGKSYSTPAQGDGRGSGGKTPPGASEFSRVLKAGQNQDNSNRQATNAHPAASKSAGSATSGTSSLPTYQTTKVMAVGDLAADFRTEGGKLQTLMLSNGHKAMPSVAIMDMTGNGNSQNGQMQQIGNTIFVDQSNYSDWKAGSNENGFEKNLYQMVARSLNSLQ